MPSCTYAGDDEAVDGPVALDDVVAELAPDLVGAGAARDVVVAPQLRPRRLDRVAVVEQRDAVLADAGRVVLHRRQRRAAHVGAAVVAGRDARAVDRRPGQLLEARIVEVGAVAAFGVVAGDRVVAGAAVDDSPSSPSCRARRPRWSRRSAGRRRPRRRAGRRPAGPSRCRCRRPRTRCRRRSRSTCRHDGVEVDRAAEVDADAVGRAVRVERRAVGARDLAVVAEDQVVAAEAVEDVVPAAAEQDVVERAADDRVAPAVLVREADRLDRADDELVDRVRRQVVGRCRSRPATRAARCRRTAGCARHPR